MQSKFFEVLFESNEQVCFSKDPYGTFVRPLSWMPQPTEQFFVINPLKEKRLDANVTSCRNILVEFDKIPLDEQKPFLVKSGLPYSTLVYSGGKSLHAIISLQWPMANKEHYKALVKRVYDKLGGKKFVDTSTSNPSRFSRTPCVTRDNGKEQTLLEVHERVPNAELLDWLGPALIEVQKAEAWTSTRGLLPIRAIAFLKYGAEPGEWNAKLFTTACDLFRANYTLEAAFDMLTAVTGHLDSNDRKTVRSAMRTIKK